MCIRDRVKFDGDIADAIGAFLAIIMMPLTYSIANGIMFGIVSWVIPVSYTHLDVYKRQSRIRMPR